MRIYENSPVRLWNAHASIFIKKYLSSSAPKTGIHQIASFSCKHRVHGICIQLVRDPLVFGTRLRASFSALGAQTQIFQQMSLCNGNWLCGLHGYAERSVHTTINDHLGFNVFED